MNVEIWKFENSKQGLQLENKTWTFENLKFKNSKWEDHLSAESRQ